MPSPSIATGCMIQRAGTTRNLGVTAVRRVRVIDSRVPVVQEMEDGERRVIFPGDSSIRDVEMLWNIRNTAAWEDLETTYGYTGSFSLWYTNDDKAIVGVLSDPNEKPARHGLGRRAGAWSHVLRMHGALVEQALPTAWVGTSTGWEGDDETETSGTQVVKVVNQVTNAVVWFSAAECPWQWDVKHFTTREATSDQRRLEYAMHLRSTNIYPDFTLPIRCGNYQTAFKVETIIDWEQPFAVYPTWRTDPTEVYYVVALPDRTREYWAGKRVADHGGNLHLTCLGVRPIGGVTYSTVWLTTTQTDWLGTNEEEVEYTDVTPTAGPDGADDPDGYLDVGMTEESTVSKFGDTSSAPSAMAIAEFNDEIWGFFSTVDNWWNIAFAPQGCQVARWDGAAWTDWETLSATWDWFWGTATTYSNSGPISPPVATNAAGIYVVSSGPMSVGWTLWHYDGATWHEEIAIRTGERVMSLFVRDDGVLILGGATLTDSTWTPFIRKWISPTLTSLYTGTGMAAGNPENAVGCYGFGSFGGRYYCASYWHTIAGPGWAGILGSDDGETWTQTHQITAPASSIYFLRSFLPAVVLSDRIMWPGYCECAEDWPYYDTSWHDRIITLPALAGQPLGPGATLAGTKFYACCREQIGAVYNIVIRQSTAGLDNLESVRLQYGGSDGFNPMSFTNGFSPRISTGIWCGGIDAAGNACFWGFEGGGGSGDHRTIHDWGAGADATSIAVDETLTGSGTTRYSLRASDSLAALQAGVPAWRVLALDGSGNATFIIRGRYIERRIECDSCFVDSLIDSVAITATLHP